MGQIQGNKFSYNIFKVTYHKFLGPRVNKVKFLLEYFRKLGVVERIYCYCLIFIGVLGGISATYSAISAIAHAKFDLPCYLQ